MMAAELLAGENVFKTNAFIIINEMVDLNATEDSEYTSSLVDEVLHCIFFLGKINVVPFSPKHIFPNQEILNELEDVFPRPFQLFSSQLPNRDPFSCVLDMIVHLTGESNEDQIIEQLRNLNQNLVRGERNHLVPSVICVSQKTPGSARHYGLSMSNSGRRSGQIMVAASCLSAGESNVAWDSHVADAVMTYYPDKKKKTYFDGTIRLPKYVRCQAFNLRDGNIMPPCRACGNLFGLATASAQVWPYGNCAEVGSVSNLFKNDAEVRDEAQIRQIRDKNRRRAREHMFNHLIGLLTYTFYPDRVFNL